MHEAMKKLEDESCPATQNRIRELGIEFLRKHINDQKNKKIWKKFLGIKLWKEKSKEPVKILHPEFYILGTIYKVMYEWLGINVEEYDSIVMAHGNKYSNLLFDKIEPKVIEALASKKFTDVVLEIITPYMNEGEIFKNE